MAGDPLNQYLEAGNALQTAQTAKRGTHSETVRPMDWREAWRSRDHQGRIAISPRSLACESEA